MSRITMTHHMRPAGGLPLIGMMLAVAVVCLGTASQLIDAGDAVRSVPVPQQAALPTAIDGLGELPLPPG
ncbi:MAG: hypothetical protein ACFCVH_05670 [Alphaproteobacteria bacterium]